MYETSEAYKLKIYKESVKHVLNLYITGTKIDDKYIGQCTTSHYLFTDGFLKLGSVSAQALEIELYKNAIKSLDNLTIFMESGIKDEIIPMGYFNLDSYEEINDSKIKLKLYDNMMKFEFLYDVSTIKKKIDDEGYVLVEDLFKDLCKQAKVEYGNIDFLGAKIKITNYDNSLSARKYLSYIAEIAGGFAFIGRDGKVYIKKIGEKIAKIPLYFMQDFKFNKKNLITKIRFDDGVRLLEKGNETGNTLNIDSENMYIIDQSQIDSIYDYYKNFELYGFTGKTQIDPSYDIGDIIEIDGKRILYQGTRTYAGKWKANIASDLSIKEKEETTVKKQSQTVVNRRIFSEFDQVNNKITIQSSYIDENTKNIGLIEITANTLMSKVSADGISSTIEQTANTIHIKSNKFAVTSTYFTLTETGTITATSGRIAGIQFNQNGLYYSGSSKDDGFGLWKTGVHKIDNTYVVFHAGGNNTNIGGANFRVLQNGVVYASQFNVVSNRTDGTGIHIQGAVPFLDFKANNSANYTSRIIDYGDQLIIASNADLTIANRDNTLWRGLRCNRVYFDSTSTLIFEDDGAILLAADQGVSCVNGSNTDFTSINASEYKFLGSTIILRASGSSRYIASRANGGFRSVSEDGDSFAEMRASEFAKQSSRRYKENIKSLSEDEANKLLNLEVVSFDYKKDSMMKGKSVAGLIAESTYEVLPNTVTMANIDQEIVPDAIDYSNFVPYLIKKIQMLDKEIKSLRKE